jgi:hypothetical protein
MEFVSIEELVPKDHLLRKIEPFPIPEKNSAPVISRNPAGHEAHGGRSFLFFGGI